MSASENLSLILMPGSFVIVLQVNVYVTSFNQHFFGHFVRIRNIVMNSHSLLGLNACLDAFKSLPEGVILLACDF
jgi:hypothetical protein